MFYVCETILYEGIKNVIKWIELRIKSGLLGFENITRIKTVFYEVVVLQIDRAAVFWYFSFDIKNKALVFKTETFC